MKQSKTSVMEQQLTQILAELPVPIRIVRNHLEDGESWYRWEVLLTGAGGCSSFEEAMRQALTYVLTTLQAQGKPSNVLLLRPEQPTYQPSRREPEEN